MQVDQAAMYAQMSEVKEGHQKVFQRSCIVLWTPGCPVLDSLGLLSKSGGFILLCWREPCRWHFVQLCMKDFLHDVPSYWSNDNRSW